METNLSSEEIKAVRECCRRMHRHVLLTTINATLLLFFGGMLIVGAIIFVINRRDDAAVFSVFAPAVIAGLLAMVLVLVPLARSKELRLLLRILSKT